MNKKEILEKNKEEIEKLNESIKSVYESFGLYDDDDYDDPNIEEEIWNMNNNPQYHTSEYESKKRKLLLENKKLIYEIEKENFDDEFAKLSSDFKSGTISNDKESSFDTLERELLAKILVRHIVKKDVETPINIGVFGEWGEGKSSFLRLMQNEINNLNSTKYNHICYAHIIKYDASEYDEKNKIWASLLSAMFERFENKCGSKGKIKFAIYNSWKSLKMNKIKYIINFFVIVLSIIFLVYLSNAESILEKFKKDFFAVAGIVPLILFVTNILIPFVKNQLEFIKPLSDRVLSVMGTPDYSQELGARENIKSTFNDLINVWIGNKSERIVIFIDELDRCTEKTITEFFDAMQLLLSVKGVTVVLSVNYKSVCYSLAHNNKYYFGANIIESEKLEFGMDYLKKYINIPIHLLKNENYEYYISDILEKINCMQQSDMKTIDTNNEDKIKSNEGKTLSDDEMLFIKRVLNRFNKTNHLTPREIKNIINIIILSKELIFKSNLSKRDSVQINFENYLNWFFYHYFNRMTSKKILKRITEFKEEELYNTFKETYDDKKFDDIFEEVKQSEQLNKIMFSLLYKIKIIDVKKYKSISFWFIGEWMD